MDNVSTLTHPVDFFSLCLSLVHDFRVSLQCKKTKDTYTYTFSLILVFLLAPFEVCVDEKIILPCSSIAFLPIRTMCKMVYSVNNKAKQKTTKKTLFILSKKTQPNE